MYTSQNWQITLHVDTQVYQIIPRYDHVIHWAVQDTKQTTEASLAQYKHELFAWVPWDGLVGEGVGSE